MLAFDVELMTLSLTLFGKPWTIKTFLGKKELYLLLPSSNDSKQLV